VLVKKDPRARLRFRAAGYSRCYGSIIGFICLAAIRASRSGVEANQLIATFVRDLGSLASWLGATGFVLNRLGLENLRRGCMGLSLGKSLLGATPSEAIVEPA